MADDKKKSVKNESGNWNVIMPNGHIVKRPMKDTTSDEVKMLKAKGYKLEKDNGTT